MNLQGHIKGNKRLRRRVDALKERVERLEYLVGRLVTNADRMGYGDEEVVVTAARAIGWGRWADEKRERISAIVKEHHR